MTTGFTASIVVREEVYSLTRMPRVVIKASDVAAIVGQNKFKSRQEVFDDLWKKYSPENFTSKTKKELAEEAVSKSETAQLVIDLAAGVEAKSSAEAESVFKRAERIINSDSKLDSGDKVKVVEHLRSKVYTGHGIEEAVSKSETAQLVIDLASGVEAKSSAEAVFRSAERIINSDSKLDSGDKVKVVEHLRSKVYTGHGIRKEDETARRCGLDLERDDTFHSMYIGTYNDRDYVVVGRVDRIEMLPDGSRILVEIKNRTKGLFRRVYPSENVQIQVYLDMLDLDKAKLVEQYNDEVNVMEVQRDKKMFEKEIFPALENFCFELGNSLL
jgi:hypothetical protein